MRLIVYLLLFLAVTVSAQGTDGGAGGDGAGGDGTGGDGAGGAGGDGAGGDEPQGDFSAFAKLEDGEVADTPSVNGWFFDGKPGNREILYIIGLKDSSITSGQYYDWTLQMESAINTMTFADVKPAEGGDAASGDGATAGGDGATGGGDGATAGGDGAGAGGDGATAGGDGAAAGGNGAAAGGDGADADKKKEKEKVYATEFTADQCKENWKFAKDWKDVKIKFGVVDINDGKHDNIKKDIFDEYYKGIKEREIPSIIVIRFDKIYVITGPTPLVVLTDAVKELGKMKDPKQTK